MTRYQNIIKKSKKNILLQQKVCYFKRGFRNSLTCGKICLGMLLVLKYLIIIRIDNMVFFLKGTFILREGDFTRLTSGLLFNGPSQKLHLQNMQFWIIGAPSNFLECPPYPISPKKKTIIDNTIQPWSKTSCFTTVAQNVWKWFTHFYPSIKCRFLVDLLFGI